jgi:hypothetical protein
MDEEGGEGKKIEPGFVTSLCKCLMHGELRVNFSYFQLAFPFKCRKTSRVRRYLGRARNSISLYAFINYSFVSKNFVTISEATLHLRFLCACLQGEEKYLH